VSEDHGYKTNGLRNIMNVLKKADPECSFALYLVVPTIIYDSVKFQTYRHSSNNKVDYFVDNEIMNVQQFKLELPFRIDMSNELEVRAQEEEKKKEDLEGRAKEEEKDEEDDEPEESLENTQV